MPKKIFVLDSEVKQIRSKYLEGYTISQLSSFFNFSKHIIYKHIKDIARKSTAHLKGNKYRVGKKLSKKHKLRIKETQKGRIKSKEECTNISNSKKGIKFTKTHRIKLSLVKTGEKLFTGFKRSINDRLRHSQYYKNWRTEVFKRDNYTCQECGKKNCYLEAHHIKPFSKYPELRFEISNGITVCRNCHAEIDSFRIIKKRNVR
jgi:transposase